MKINQLYKHVDNGGIAITIETIDNTSNCVKIDFEADYYGYPSVSSSLNLFSIDSVDFLLKFSDMLKEAASTIKSLNTPI